MGRIRRGPFEFEIQAHSRVSLVDEREEESLETRPPIPGILWKAFTPAARVTASHAVRVKGPNRRPARSTCIARMPS